MERKTISVSEDVYEDLESERADDESLSDVIERLLPDSNREHPLYELEGLLDEDEASQVRKRISEFRRNLDAEMEDRQEK